MKNFIAISSLLLLLCGCAISNSTHSFVHYGTDTLRDDSDFFYIKYGVLGSASVMYNRQGGGNVRSGLIADAKSDMSQQHALGPNQTYINMTIDVIRTENGKTSSQGNIINSVTITAVVSADIIEYGLPPENYKPIVQSAKLLPTDNSAPNEIINNETTPTVQSAKLLQTDNSAPNEIINNETTPTEYFLGESVIYTKSNKSYDAIIIGFGEYNFSDRVKIEYINESGTTKKRWAYMEVISKK